MKSNISWGSSRYIFPTMSVHGDYCDKNKQDSEINFKLWFQNLGLCWSCKHSFLIRIIELLDSSVIFESGCGGRGSELNYLQCLTDGLDSVIDRVLSSSTVLIWLPGKSSVVKADTSLSDSADPLHYCFYWWKRIVHNFMYYYFFFFLLM